MGLSVQVVHGPVSGIQPGDAVEWEHRTDTLKWLETTNDVYRRAKPATPERHLVSHVVLVDPDDASILLVDHRNARLWPPPGGHVEPGEHPTDTARREAHEELGIDPVLVEPSGQPSFITVTRTGGVDAGHTDVSLWYLLVGRRGMNLVIDVTEFNQARWWTPADMQAADPEGFDPHYLRFVDKGRRSRTRCDTSTGGYRPTGAIVRWGSPTGTTPDRARREVSNADPAVGLFAAETVAVSGETT
jgi:8-oxo-dGTP diphosphatase